MASTAMENGPYRPFLYIYNRETERETVSTAWKAIENDGGGRGERRPLFMMVGRTDGRKKRSENAGVPVGPVLPGPGRIGMRSTRKRRQRYLRCDVCGCYWLRDGWLVGVGRRVGTRCRDWPFEQAAPCRGVLRAEPEWGESGELH